MADSLKLQNSEPKGVLPNKVLSLRLSKAKEADCRRTLRGGYNSALLSQLYIEERAFFRRALCA
jgi:hypothetical protein